ncbi:MAG: LutB/LldF family L-lactate oxidation iron-sulfur protein, partial [Gemmatales bacterium]|nr:LutB/LldF family L-lactate oxidation iron-sulfur protein [Gemmatales bacterium]MDW8386706.1 LutB/LldF family L-lactate oxidation iron-sulfur protein [Gemmatales bacterium]
MTDYSREEHHEFMAASRSALADGRLQLALVRLTSTLTAANRRGYDSLPESDLVREQAKQIKAHTLAHLDRYLEQLEASVRSVGGFVHWAEDAEQARRIIGDIAWSHGVRRVVKAKSMTTEEIHLNDALQQAGIEVTETDFGEFVIQLSRERPSHIVAPAVHHTRESIARLISEYVGETIPDDPQILAKTGRRVLRKKFFEADMGITGVNFAVAETGTLVLVTNEGNGRLTTTWPRIHVAVMGMEKVIPRWRDLPVFLKLLARAATGHPLSVYTTLITGPARHGDLDGPDELHLVILDNGRSDILASPFRESLQCIRCGACLNACPVYRRIGGHAYGGVYSGPIGSILTPLYDSVTENPHLPHASSLCGACQAACPVKINIPHLLIGLRELQHEKKRNRWEDLTYGIARRVLQRPWLYRLMSRIMRWTLRPWSQDGWLKNLPGPASGWTQCRDFPAPA